MVRVMSVVPSRYCAPGVQQQKTFRFQCDVRFGGGFVMDNSSMLLIAGDRVETFSHIQRLRGPECVQLFVYADFRFFSCGNCFVQPLQELD